MPTLVEPQVRLIARPQVNWDAIEEYLTSISGQAWTQQQDGTDAESIVEFGGRLCYKSWAPGLNPNVTRVRTDSAEYLENILKSGHGSVIEHANFTFLFENFSRVFTHELVRHRAGWAYSQESMRFVRLDNLPFWFPKWAQGDPELMDRALALLAQMEEFQIWMAQHFGLDDEGVVFHEKKAKTSFMRRFAPQGVGTQTLATGNVRALRHFVEMRSDAGAEEEIRIAARGIYDLMRVEVPYLFGDYTVSESGALTSPYRKV